MDMTKDSIEVLLEKLSSSAPFPGGGGASALVGALSASLGTMVGSLTVGKPKYADVEEDIKALMEKSEDLKKQLAELMNEDARAFEPLSKAYSIPKDDPSREHTLEQCLRAAAAVPMRILELSCEAAELLAEYEKKGSRIVVSDAATGAAFCQAAIKGAAVNVKVNTRLMRDRAYAEAVDRKVRALVEKYVPFTDAIAENYL